jgi:hypothetical protein
MSSIMLPLLAAALAPIPSDGPARLSPGPARASVAAGVTIVPAERVDWSRVAGRTGLSGEVRHELHFQ